VLLDLTSPNVGQSLANHTAQRDMTTLRIISSIRDATIVAFPRT